MRPGTDTIGLAWGLALGAMPTALGGHGLLEDMPTQSRGHGTPAALPLPGALIRFNRLIQNRLI